MLADTLAFVLLLAVAVYAAAGGTDYGAGFWDLVAGGRERGEAPRALIDHAMAPVWEANNVWLIFAAVVCWTSFPILWQSVFASLYPLLLVGVLGLVLRGVGFAFRKVTRTIRGRRVASVLFGSASILAPFCFSAALGAVASGRVGVGAPVVPIWQACLNPTSIAFGVVGVGATAFTGAVFLMMDARRYGAVDLIEYFRRRAIGAAIATVVVALASIAVLSFDGASVFRGLGGPVAAGFAVLALLAIGAVFVMLWTRRHRFVRVLTIVGVGSFVFAWGFAQSPDLIPHRLTIAQGAGATSSLMWFGIVTIVAVAVVAPSLGLLYWLDQRNDLTADSDQDVSEEGASKEGGRGSPP